MVNMHYKDYLICKICSNTASDHTELISHVKSHRISPKAYFNQYFPKADLLTGDKVDFKSFEQFSISDFVDKRNLKLWLKQIPREEACVYLRNKLQAYCKLKGLTYAPSQSEIKTITCLPSIDIFELYCEESFNSICEAIGLKTKFDYKTKYTQADFSNYSQQDIVIDTREQTPLKFKGLNVISSKLECGDYAKSVSAKLMVERKSLNDFYSTLSGGLERFKKEIARAKSLGTYVVVLTECKLNTVLYAKRRFGACSGDFVMHHMRQICREFDNVQFVFCDGRAEASQQTLYILEMGDKAQKTDLQHLFDMGGFVWL
jgi:hypothetical protein